MATRCRAIVRTGSLQSARRTGLVGISLLLISAVSVEADANSNDRAMSNLRPLVARLVDGGATGAMLILSENNDRQIVSLGRSSKPMGRPMAPTDVWRVASVTKMVAAIVAVQLVGEGKLALDNPVSQYLPGVVPEGARITIRHLLNHTSGIPDYLSDPRAPLQGSAKRLVADLLAPRSFNATLRVARRLPRPFEPGDMHEYSNTNYVLLGRIVERIEGTSFAESVRKRILRPFGLTRSGFASKTGRIPFSRIRAYLPDDESRRPAAASKRVYDVTRHTYFLGADGGLYSNGLDLVRLLDGIWQGPILNAASRDVLTNDLVEDHDGQYRYGLGVMAFPTSCGTTVYGHEGRDLGSFTLALTDRARMRHLVLVMNRPIDGLSGADKTLGAIRNAAFCDA